MAPEDMREDLIENEPNPSVDEVCADEKTWSWLASHSPFLKHSTQHNTTNQLRLHAETVVIDFL